MGARDRVELNFELPVRMKFSHYEVDVNRGRLALSRGPWFIVWNRWITDPISMLALRLEWLVYAMAAA
jgi:DUF1680 family protein